MLIPRVQKIYAASVGKSSILLPLSPIRLLIASGRDDDHLKL